MPPATMYASPIVLIFSRPYFSASASNDENTLFSIAKIWFGDRPSARVVKFTMSANITVTSAKPSAIVPSSILRRSATGPGRMLSSSRSERSCSACRSRCASSSRSFDFSRSTAANRSRRYTMLEIATKLSAKKTTIVFGGTGGGLTPSEKIQ